MPDGSDSGENGINRRKILKTSMVGIGGSAGLAGCLTGNGNGNGNGNGGGTPTDPDGDFDGTFTFGRSAVVTGPVGTSYELWKTGVDLAIQKINSGSQKGPLPFAEEGGVMVDGERLALDYKDYDNECSPDQGISNFLRFVENDGFNIVMGGLCSSVTLAMMEEAVNKEIPLLTANSVAPEITAPGDTNEWTFRSKETSAMRAEGLGQKIQDELGGDHVGILAMNNDYGVGQADAYEAAFQEIGMEVNPKIMYQPGQQDFSTEVTNLRQSDADIYYLVPDSPDSCGTLIPQVLQAGLKPENIVAAPFCGIGDAAERAGDALEGVHVELSFNPFQKEPERVATFVEDFQEMTEQNLGEASLPDVNSLYYHEATLAIANAVQQANSTDPHDIRDALAETQIPNMVAAYPDYTLEFDEYGQAFHSGSLLCRYTEDLELETLA